MFENALAIAQKDVTMMWRRRQIFTQLLPFALLSMVLFGIAFDADRPLLTRVAPGLVWIIMLLEAVLISGQTFSVEHEDGARERLRTFALDPAALFLGKALTIFLALSVVLMATIIGVIIFFNVRIEEPIALLATSIVGVAGIAASVTMYSALTNALRGGHDIMPILVLPVLAPVLLGASRAWENALGITAGTPWSAFAFVAAFAVVFWSLGVVAMGWMESQ